MSYAGAGRAFQQELMLWADPNKKQPALQAILDASRQNNYISIELQNQMRFADKAGKNRNVIVNSYLPNCDATADDCSGSVCDSGETMAPSQETFSISECTSSKVFQFKVDDIRLIDGNISFSRNAVMQVLSILGSVREKLAKQVIADLVANVGTHNDGSATKQIAFTDPSDAALRPLGLWQIQREFLDIGLSDPYIIGGEDVYTWLRAVAIGGLNQQGINTGQLPTANMYYDAMVENVINDPSKGHIIAFDPKMVKFVSYVNNAGIFATTPYDSINDLDALYSTSGSLIKGTYQDPVTGLLFDLNIRKVDCPDELFTFEIKLHWDIWYPPEYFCADNAGVNGIFEFTTCKTVPADCPST